MDMDITTLEAAYLSVRLHSAILLLYSLATAHVENINGGLP